MPSKLLFNLVPCKAKDLQPGDLFTSYPAEYWNALRDGAAVGERVYVRTEAPAANAPDLEEKVWRISWTVVQAHTYEEVAKALDDAMENGYAEFLQGNSPTIIAADMQRCCAEFEHTDTATLEAHVATWKGKQ